MAPSILLIDNVDSFTFMLADYLAVLGADVRVVRNDGLSLGEAMDKRFDGHVISPGPGRPEDAGISVEVARACIAGARPLLGVCLGHQAIAVACGQRVDATSPVHGKTDQLSHDGSGLFAGLPGQFSVTRYHSLAVPDPQPPLIVNAWGRDGTVMGMRHANAPVHGVQFHPESIATEHGHALLAAFLEGCPQGA